MKHGYSREDAFTMAMSNKFVKEGFFSALSEGSGGLILGGGYMGKNMLQGYKNFKNFGGTSYIYGGVEINEKTTAKDVLEQLNNRKTMQTEMAEGDAQFAIKESKTMGKVAFLDGKRIQRQKGESVNHAIRRYFNETFKNRIITVEESQDNVKLDQIGKYLYPGEAIGLRDEKRAISSILDEIIEIGTDKQWSQNLLDENGNVKNHAGLDCDGGFNYYDTKFAVDNSGVIYGGRVIARIDKNGRAYFYDIDKIREVGYQDENEFYPVRSLSTSLEDSLPQNGETVNSNDMQSFGDYADDFEYDEEYAQGVLDAARSEMEAIPEATRKMMDFYSKFANVRFIVGDTDALAGKKAAGAYVNSSDVILLDFDTVQDSNEVARKIVNHELTHSAERSKHYDALKEYAFSHMFNESNTKDSAIAKKIERYGKRGVPLDTTGAEAELVAEYMGKLMSSPEAVNKMAMENKPLAKNVLDSLVETYKKVTTYFKDKEAYEARYALSDIEQGIRLFEKALKTRTSVSDVIARGMGIDTRAMGESDGVQYANAYNYDTPETLNSGIVNQKALKDYYANVDKVLNGTYKGTDAIIMGGTPKIMTDIGLNKLPIAISQGHIYSIAKTDAEAKAEGRYKGNVNYHGLGDVAVKEILDKISNPIAIVAHPDFVNYPKRDSAHKVIVLVNLRHNGNQVIAPIEIDSEQKIGNSRMDTNYVATYFDRSNASDILKEAVALENQHKTGFYFADIKKVEALLKGSGYQSPSSLRTHDSNIIIRKIDENVNRKIDTVLKSKQFVDFFGDWQNNPKKASKVVNDDGTPKILYHQTANVFTVFDTRHKGAGASDNETPFGIFLKPTSEKIGVKGDIQMPLYANIRNPLEVANRGDLVKALQSMSSDFVALYEEHKELDRKYQSKFDEATKQFKEYITKWRAENPDASRQALYDDPEFNEVFEAEERITDEWSTAARELELKTKEVITKALKDNNFDGVHLLEDAGSFGKTTETYIALEPTQVKSATDNIGTYDKTNPDIQFSSPVASADTEAESDVKIKSNKAKSYYERYSRTAKKDVGKLLGIPKSRLGVIDGNIDTLAGEYFHNGKISDASKEALFEKAWKEGIVIDDSNTEFAKSLRKDLKSSTLYISPEDAKDIPDFGVWRRSQLGNMMLSTKNGYSVDSKYQELNAEYGDNYFPLNITAPSDQLLRIAEVMEKLKPVEYTLEEREGQHKEDYRKEFMKGLGEFEKRLEDVSRYEKAKELSDVQNVYGRDELTVEEAKAIYDELKNARKNYEKVMAKELLTDADKKKVEQVLAGDMDIEDIKGSKFNVEGIKKAVEARTPVDLLDGALKKHKAAVKARRFETAEKFLEGSDFWKEKKFGISYSAENMERNFYDIMGKGSEKKAKELIDHYFEPVHEHEAQSTRNKNAYRQRVADLELSQKIKKGNKTSESFAVQFLGEVESDLERLSKFKTNGIFNKKVGTKTHFATQQEVDRYIDYAYMYAYETNELGNKEFPKQNDKIVISKADDRLINDVKETYGIDLSEAYHVLNDNDIRHIKNSHGEDTNEKYPVTAEDLKQIPDIIKNYDDVIYLSRAGKTGLYYIKRHNGVTYYLESINDEGTALTNKQMIKVSTGTIPDVPGLKEAINKKWNIDSAPNDSNVPRMYVQDVKNSNVPTNIVAQNKKVVNPIEKSRTQRILELRKQKEIFLRENPNLDYDKIYGAISEFRTIYDELFTAMNGARIRNGYAPVEYRQGYFPHFLTDAKKGINKDLASELGIGDYEAQGGIFDKFTKALGISTDVSSLPTNIAASSFKNMLIPIGMIMGYFVVSAEPAVHSLKRQVSEITNGAIPQKAVAVALSIGVSVSVGISMLRVLTGIPIMPFLIFGYSVSLIISFFVPNIYTGIAFDSGGVASGPMTSTFMLPFAMGACEAIGGNVMTDAFGIVAMIAMTPLITIQTLGLNERRTRARMLKKLHSEISMIEDDIIFFDEEGEIHE